MAIDGALKLNRGILRDRAEKRPGDVNFQIDWGPRQLGSCEKF